MDLPQEIKMKSGLTVDEVILVLNRKRRNAPTEAERIDAEDELQLLYQIVLKCGLAQIID